MEAEKLIEKTAINVKQRVYEFKSTKKASHDDSFTSCFIVKIERDWHN